MPEPPVLLVKTHAFGDALMCTPAARELAGRGLELWALTGPSAASVWERQKGVTRVFVAPAPPKGVQGRLALLAWTLRRRNELRRAGSSMVFQGSPLVRRWVRYLTSNKVVSCGGKPLGDWETVFPLEPGQLAGHVFARVAGVDVSDWRPEFPVKPSETAWAEGLGLSRPLFAIAPGGGRNPRDTVLQKRWAPEGFARMADRLSASGLRVVLLGGDGDRDAAKAVSDLCGRELLDMTGRTTWGQTGAVLDMCCGFLGADSGAAHLAAARGVPSVVLFGPSSHSALYPQGLVTPVSARVDCSPCYSNSVFPGCPNDSALCMESIDEEDVWSALEATLAACWKGAT